MNLEKTQTDQNGLNGRSRKGLMSDCRQMQLTRSTTSAELNLETLKMTSRDWALKIGYWVWVWLVVSTFLVGLLSVNVLYRIQVRGDMLTMGPPYQWEQAETELPPQNTKKR